MKAETCGASRLNPVFARRLQHIKRAGDIGLDEIAGPVNRAVHMALGRQMHHHIGGMGGKDPVQGGAVPYIGLLKGIVGMIRH